MSIVFNPSARATIINILRDPKVPMDERRVYNSAVIASGTAYSLPLPAEHLPFPVDYFNSKYLAVVKDLVSSINEEEIIDITTTLEATKLIWVNRYMAAYNPCVDAAITLVKAVMVNTTAMAAGSDLSSIGQGINPQANPAGELPYEQQQGEVSLESYLSQHTKNVAFIVSACLAPK